MKPFNIALALVRFNLRNLPWYIWPLVATVSWFHGWSTEIISSWDLQGYSITGLTTLPFFSWAMIGSTFFEKSNARDGQLEYDDAMLANPTLCRMAQISRVVLFFVLMLTPTLVEVYVATEKPDFRVYFYHRVDGNITVRQVQFYHDQFPNSLALNSPDPGQNKAGYETTLLIPSGKLLIAYWQLVLAFVGALITQIFMFTRRRRQIGFLNLFGTLYGTMILAYLFVSCVLVMFNPGFGLPPGPSLYESAFFFFAHHTALVCLLTLGGVALVEGMALRRIQDGRATSQDDV